MSNNNNGHREIPGWEPPAGTIASAERDARLRREADERQRRHDEHLRSIREQENRAIEAQRRKKLEEKRRSAAESRAQQKRQHKSKTPQSSRRAINQKQRTHTNRKQSSRPKSIAKPKGFKRNFLYLATVLSVLGLFYCGFLIGNHNGWTGSESAMMGGFLALFSRSAAYLLWYAMVLSAWLAGIYGIGWIILYFVQ